MEDEGYRLFYTAKLEQVFGVQLRKSQRKEEKTKINDTRSPHVTLSARERCRTECGWGRLFQRRSLCSFKPRNRGCGMRDPVKYESRSKTNNCRERSGDGTHIARTSSLSPFSLPLSLAREKEGKEECRGCAYHSEISFQFDLVAHAVSTTCSQSKKKRTLLPHWWYHSERRNGMQMHSLEICQTRVYGIFNLSHHFVSSCCLVVELFFTRRRSVIVN